MHCSVSASLCLTDYGISTPLWSLSKHWTIVFKEFYRKYYAESYKCTYVRPSSLNLPLTWLVFVLQRKEINQNCVEVNTQKPSRTITAAMCSKSFEKVRVWCRTLHKARSVAVSSIWCTLNWSSSHSSGPPQDHISVTKMFIVVSDENKLISWSCNSTQLRFIIKINNT